MHTAAEHPVSSFIISYRPELSLLLTAQLNNEHAPFGIVFLNPDSTSVTVNECLDKKKP
jgi:hypothetical protein